VTKGKSATDMKMTIDAMDLLFRGRVHAFGIMSSDSDFMPLAMRIRQDGLPVYGFGSPTTPQGFRQACTRFINVLALAGEPPEPVAAPAAPAPARSAAAKAAKPDAGADTPIAMTLPPAIAAAPKREKAPVDEVLLKLLIDAYDASKRDEKGFVSLSAMGQLAANRSSFDVRNYGYKRLSDLIEAVPNFQIEQRTGGRSYVRRLR
ncbi:MAG TPA: NYN domain-containing protein, partial [Sphingomonas sp.]